jgi:hypothetical protein
LLMLKTLRKGWDAKFSSCDNATLTGI